jgi:alpha-tubulin suppressor-like RCC1 family protein
MRNIYAFPAIFLLCLGLTQSAFAGGGGGSRAAPPGFYQEGQDTSMAPGTGQGSGQNAAICASKKINNESAADYCAAQFAKDLPTITRWQLCKASDLRGAHVYQLKDTLELSYANCPVLDGQGITLIAPQGEPHFRATETAHIQNITLACGRNATSKESSTQQNGGSILAKSFKGNQKLSLYNVQFYGNLSYAQGGALAAEGMQVQSHYSCFHQNKALRGGAVYLESSSQQIANFANTDFTNNSNPGCGDGVKDHNGSNSDFKLGEQCDDGDRLNNDACVGECQNAHCGDGYVWNTGDGNEECDDGAHCDNGDECTSSADCVEGEECLKRDGDGCDSNCTPTGCGNGIITGEEKCDLGSVSDSGCIECKIICTEENACNPGEEGECIIPTGCQTCSNGTTVEHDADSDNVCDDDEITGCQNQVACNYNALATDAAACVFPTGCQTCSNGTTVEHDADNDNVCDDDEITGCQNQVACNYNALATDAAACVFPTGCDQTCGSTLENDECGVCAGSGIPQGACDCASNVLDCNGECGGSALVDACGVCNGPDPQEYCFDEDGDGLGAGTTQTYCDDQIPDGWVNNCDDLQPTCASDDCEAIEIAYGKWHACARLANGQVKCWGSLFHGQGLYGNEWGQLGAGFLWDLDFGHYPGDIHTSAAYTVRTANNLPLSGVKAISAGAWHTCALMNNGGVKCWGSDRWGQLGDGPGSPTICTARPTTFSQAHIPCATQAVDVVLANGSPLMGVQAVAAGQFHTCSHMQNGGIKCWGDDTFGQLGDGIIQAEECIWELESRLDLSRWEWKSTCSTTPIDVLETWGGEPLKNVMAISAGADHSCALMDDATLRCWGSDTMRNEQETCTYDPSGTGGYTAACDTVPTPMMSKTGDGPLTGVEQIFASSVSHQTCALMSNDTMQCTEHPEDKRGNLYSERNDQIGKPRIISHNLFHLCVLLEDSGEIKCTGHEAQVGSNPDPGSNYDPSYSHQNFVNLLWDDARTRVSGASAIATGWYGTCAIINGGVMCWNYLDKPIRKIAEIPGYLTHNPPQVRVLADGEPITNTLWLTSGSTVQFEVETSDDNGLGYPIFSWLGSDVDINYVWDFSGGETPGHLYNFSPLPLVTFNLKPGQSNRSFEMSVTTFDKQNDSTIVHVNVIVEPS